MPRRPSTDAEFRIFCRNGRGWTFATINQRLHKADCALLRFAYWHDKFVWEWEALAQVTAYLNRHRQGWQPCPFCCDAQLGQHARTQGAGATHGTPPTASPPTELQRAYQVFHLAEGCPLAIAEAAYKATMKTAHPDVGGSEEQAREATWAIEIIRAQYQHL